MEGPVEKESFTGGEADVKRAVRGLSEITHMDCAAQKTLKNKPEDLYQDKVIYISCVVDNNTVAYKRCQGPFI